MKRSSTLLKTAVAVMASAALFVGCGGDSGSKDLGDLTGDGGSNDLGDLGDISSDCLKASSAFTEASAEFDTYLNNNNTDFDVEQFRSDVEDARRYVPDEIKDAFDTYMNALIQYADAYKGVDPNDPSSMENLDDALAALEALTNPEVTAALEEVTNYFTSECTGG